MKTLSIESSKVLAVGAALFAPAAVLFATECVCKNTPAVTAPDNSKCKSGWNLVNGSETCVNKFAGNPGTCQSYRQVDYYCTALEVQETKDGDWSEVCQGNCC